MIADNHSGNQSQDQAHGNGTVFPEEVIRLHQRSVCGEELRPEEEAKLQEWYAEQDREEAEQLRLASRKLSLAELEARIEYVIQQIDETIRLNRQLAAQNDTLLSEITALRQQLSYPSFTQTAG